MNDIFDNEIKVMVDFDDTAMLCVTLSKTDYSMVKQLSNELRGIKKLIRLYTEIQVMDSYYKKEITADKKDGYIRQMDSIEKYF